MSITTFTISVLIAYLLFLKLVSYFAYKVSTPDKEDYFLAKRNVGFLVLTATTMASVFSTGTVVSSPASFFSRGTGFFWIFFFSFLPLTMMVFSLKFWKLGKSKSFITPGDCLGDFYCSRKVSFVTGLIGLLAMIPHAAAQLVAIGKTFEALTGGSIPYFWGITIVTFAIAFYLYFGGSRAVIWTDTIQGILFGSLLIISVFCALYWANGWKSMILSVHKSAPQNFQFSGTVSYFEFFFPCISLLFIPYFWQRIFMAKSARALGATILVIPIIFVLFFFASWVIGSSAVALFPNGLPDGDTILGAIFSSHAPYFGAFILVAAFAAGMSTVDSQLLSSGSIFVQDMNFIFNRNKKENSEYAIARISTCVLLIGVYIWSCFLQSQSVLSLLMLGTNLNIVFLPTVIGMFYWKKSSTLGALCSLWVGLIVYFVKYFTYLGAFFPTSLGAISWSLISSIFTFIVISLISNGSLLDRKREEYSQILSISTTL